MTRVSESSNLNRRGFIGAVGAVGALGIVGGAADPAFAQKAAAPQAATGTSGLSPRKGSFELMEATIADIHEAYRRGQLTCRKLVQQYLDRIAAYDKQGPALKAIITLNPRALEIADDLDRQYRRSGLTGPLHGIPVILKDNFDTFDLPTSGGNTAMRNSMPPADAFAVEKMRKAGYSSSPRPTCRSSPGAATRSVRWAGRSSTLTTSAGHRAGPAAGPVRRSRRTSPSWARAVTRDSRSAPLPLPTASSAYAPQGA